MRTRSGAVSLAELVLTFCLFGLVLTGLARFTAAQGRLAGAQRDRTRAQEAVRVAHAVLEAELRYLAPGDIRTLAGDSIRIRAVRGSGAVCRVDGTDLFVRYRGVRAPDPAKDSVLFVSGASLDQPLAAEPLAIEAAAEADACGPGTRRMTLERRPLEGAGFVLLYEAGTYFVSGQALRYRRGAGGRQPLTEAVMLGSALTRGHSGAIELRLLLDPDSLPRAPADAILLILRGLNGTPE